MDILIAGEGTTTVTLLSETPTGMQVMVDDGGGNPVAEFVENTMPIDPAKLPGTYRATQNGEM